MKLSNFLEILQISLLKYRFFSFCLPFSLRFESSIEFPSIHHSILQLNLSFDFQFSEFSLVKLSNFLSFLQIFPSKWRFYSPFSVRFESSIEFPSILHLNLSFEFQFSEFAPIKLSNFLYFLERFSFNCCVFPLFSHVFTSI